MFRISTVLVIASVGVASAGQIQIGGVTGLTGAYVASGCSGAGSCIAGSVGNFTEQNYDSVLFSGASNGTNTPTPYSTYSTGNANVGTITDPTSGETFAMIDDGVKTGGGSRNVWIGTTNATTDTLTIPIGVFGVEDVWTMLNTSLALADPARDLTIEFDFASTSNGAPTSIVKIKSDNNTPASGTVATDGIQNAVQCPLSSACSTLANGAPSSSIVTASGVTILSDQLLSTRFAYTIATGGYAGTTGNVELDDQGFIFTGNTLTTALSSYLVDVKVSESNVSGSDTLGLSAITLDSVATPEPSTVLMFLAGLGAIGFGRFRRKQN